MLKSLELILISRVNHLPVRLSHRSIDERRYQVVCMTFIGCTGRRYLPREMEAIFEDVLCSFL